MLKSIKYGLKKFCPILAYKVPLELLTTSINIIGGHCDDFKHITPNIRLLLRLWPIIRILVLFIRKNEYSSSMKILVITNQRALEKNKLQNKGYQINVMFRETLSQWHDMRDQQ
ncbi:hypothetical protein RCL_jg5267.t1 [Rhizophagus clarus]|uniref:Uncharacterized protein n=1 Tax=Rhizophagus clarus TaxID=94130 RepID=A0A8H3QR30_9GLOM|nr:hypothetical protein RCL_jg5267.t1 [Rhizophagus clarus]